MWLCGTGGIFYNNGWCGLTIPPFSAYRQTKKEQVQEVLWYREDQGTEEEQERQMNKLKLDAGEIGYDAGVVVLTVMVWGLLRREIEPLTMMMFPLLMRITSVL